MRHHPTALTTPSPRIGQPGPGSAAERQGYRQTSLRSCGRCCVGGGQGLGMAQVGQAGCEPCWGPGTGSWAGGDEGDQMEGPGCRELTQLCSDSPPNTVGALLCSLVST